MRMQQPVVSTVIRGRNGDIVVRAPEGTRSVTVRIHSDRNAVIPALTDTSPHAPAGRPVITPDDLGQEQIWFPVVDLVRQPGMSAVVVFERTAQGPVRYAVNGMFHPETIDLDGGRAVVPGDRLEPWENSVFVSGSAKVTGWWLETELPVQDGVAAMSFSTLSDRWSGFIEVLAQDAEAGARQAVAVAPAEAPAVSDPGGPGIASERLIDALGAATEYVIRSQVRGSHQDVEGGFHLFYDHDARTFRTSHWNWTWGPAIKLLLDSDSVLAARAGLPSRTDVAAIAGRASLRLLQRDTAHPAYGISMVRCSPGIEYRRPQEYLSPSSPDFPVSGWAPSHIGEPFVAGFEHYYSPADTLFLMGWGWVPLAEATGDTRFVEASQLAARGCERLLDRYGVIPQDYPVAMAEWTGYTREESAFGMEGFAELYRLTGDDRVRDLGLRYFEGMRTRLERRDGLWDRHVWRDTDRVTECEFKARSLGWVGEGLIAAHRMAPASGYLEKAVDLAEHFLTWQRDSGAWGLVINQPLEQSVDSAKGTALWCLLMYRLHRFTRDERHLASARRALEWLLDEQYLGGDPDGHGGTVSCSPFSGVDYRRWFRLSCLYTSSFFGLAVLEELRLRTENG